MPVQPTFPGVYVQEVPSGVRTITGVSTSVAAFVGMVSRGPLKQPTRVLSFSDYERKFGDDTSVSEMTDQVRQFFLNGGQQAHIMRIANGAASAKVTVANEFQKDVIIFTAKEAGEIGNTIRLEVDYDTSSPESSFNVRVFRHESDGQGGLAEVEEEVFSGLTMDPGSGQYVVDVISQQSSLIDAELAASFTPSSVAFKGYALAGRTFADEADFRTGITLPSWPPMAGWRAARTLPDFGQRESVRRRVCNGSADRRRSSFSRPHQQDQHFAAGLWSDGRRQS
jgi:hypothetical protein